MHVEYYDLYIETYIYIYDKMIRKIFSIKINQHGIIQEMQHANIT